MNGSSAEAAPALAATPWPDYAPPAGSYDEVFDAHGVVRLRGNGCSAKVTNSPRLDSSHVLNRCGGRCARMV